MGLYSLTKTPLLRKRNEASSRHDSRIFKFAFQHRSSGCNWSIDYKEQGQLHLKSENSPISRMKIREHSKLLRHPPLEHNHTIQRLWEMRGFLSTLFEDNFDISVTLINISFTIRQQACLCVTSVVDLDGLFYTGSLKLRFPLPCVLVTVSWRLRRQEMDKVELSGFTDVHAKDAKTTADAVKRDQLSAKFDGNTSVMIHLVFICEPLS